MPKHGDLRISANYMKEINGDIYNVEVYLPRIGKYSMSGENCWNYLNNGQLSRFVTWFPTKREAARWMAAFMDEIERYTEWYMHYCKVIGWGPLFVDGEKMENRLMALHDRGCGPTDFKRNEDLDWMNY